MQEFNYICGMKGIYIIKNNINDKVYIGSTKNVKRRFYHHKYNLKKNKHSNPRLQKFYNKYGISSLEFKMLEIVEIDDDLLPREQYYLNKYKSKFNIDTIAGSSLGRKCSKETRIKISKKLKAANLKGRKKSEITKERMRKPKTKEHALKIKEAQKYTRKKVYQYSLNLELLNIFESVSEAGRITNIGRRDISANCNNRQKTAKGYIWSFTEKS